MQFDARRPRAHDFPHRELKKPTGAAPMAVIAEAAPQGGSKGQANMSEPAVVPRVPGRFWYVVAGILFFGAMLVPAPLILWSVFSGTDTVVRLVAPETKTVRLERGGYTVFSDSRAVIDGEIVISQGSISGLRVAVRGPCGTEIPVEAVALGTRYSYGGQTGFAVLQFSIPQAGEYTISADYRDKPKNQRALLSIRKDFLGGLVGTILSTVAASLIGAFLGVAIFLRTLWKRRALVVHSVITNFQPMGAATKPSPRTAKYSPPGSADAKSPVEHQYDRDK